VNRKLALAAVAVAAAFAPASGGARPLFLPSPTTPLDTKVPLRSSAQPTELQLPLNARLASAERVLVSVRPPSQVVGVSVVQRLTLTGTGDYFFTVPAPLQDARAAPGSQAEPGFRRNALIWQGFANERRVLAADAELDPAPAAGALPLRLALTATVDGRPPAADERRSGRLRLELRLRNTTAVRTQAFAARPVSAAAARGVASRVVSQVRKGRTPDQPILEVEGPIRTREVVVDAPLVVHGEVRLPARALDDAVATGGSLVRRGDGVAVRFRLVLGGAESTSARIALTGSARGASFPHAVVTAEPSALAALPVATGGQDAADGATRLLLSIARVHQYDALLANPAPGGPVEAVYRFTTVGQPTVAVVAPDSNTSGDARTAVVLLLALLGAGGLAVLWAHL
jgi:hypothetical protein